MKDKIKSYSFWTALSGAVVVLVQAIADCFGFSIQSELISGIIMAIAGLLVVLGVVSMPNKNGESGQNNNQSNEQDAEESQEEKTDNLQTDKDCQQDDNEK